MAQKWNLTPTQFKELDADERARMAAKAIADGWIDMVTGDV